MDKKIYNVDLKKRLYFGHPVNTYNTEIEKMLLHVIALHFPGHDIENPNKKHHQEGYKYYKETTGSGMNYFYELVLPFCDSGIFLPFRDGKWGAGVFGEALFFTERGQRIYEIDCRANIKMADIKSVKSLSIPETRQRVYDHNGNILPY